jgi:sugar phosphate isomerase/epimerase
LTILFLKLKNNWERDDMLLSLGIQTPEVPVRVPVALLAGDLEGNFAKVSRMGYDGVELITTEPAGLDRIFLKKILAQNRLRVSAIASGGMAFAAKLTLINSDWSVALLARQRLNEMIDLASDLGSPVVTLGSFRGRIVEDKSRSLQVFADILRDAGDRALKGGVRIALEPLNHYETDLLQTAGQALDFLQKVNHPAIGVLLDTYHVNIEEASWTDPYRRVLDAQKLFYVHLGDNNRLPPGKGLIDFPAILRTLQEGDYNGWLSAELLPLPDSETAVLDTVNIMRKWMGEIS